MISTRFLIRALAGVSLLAAIAQSFVLKSAANHRVNSPQVTTSSLRSMVEESSSIPSPGAVVDKTENDWKESLTAEQFYVLREEGTEAPNTSNLNSVKEDGTFICAGCGSPLFVTKTKYESGTGWPSFNAPIDAQAVKTSTDFKLVLPRTEASCATCGGHLGHVFGDGPAPTGQRYCMNGVAMNFRSDAESPELAAVVQERATANPYRVGLLDVLPSVMGNGILGGLFFNAFVTRMEANGGFQSPLDAFPLLMSIYLGVMAVQSCSRMKA